MFKMDLDAVNSDPERKERFDDYTSLISNICFNAWIVAGEPDVPVFVPTESVVPLMKDLHKNDIDAEMAELAIEHLLYLNMLVPNLFDRTHFAMRVTLCKSIAEREDKHSV